MTTSNPTEVIRQRLEKQRRRESRRLIPTEIRKRNDAVLVHLGLAHLGANRQLQLGCGERDDLVQEGRYGLIRALDHFDASRGHRVSSYAMPRINGQILHFRRDRLHTLRIPWRLGSLHARGMKVQNARLHAGLPRCNDVELSQQLGVTAQRWHQACIAHSDGYLQSLHGLRRGGGDNEDGEALIDRVKDQERLRTDPQHCWLVQTLKQIDPIRCRWLCAFWIDGLSLKEIAHREQIDRRRLQQVLKETLNALRVEASQSVSEPHPTAKPQQ